MITKFRIFEELKIGYNFKEGVNGSFIFDNENKNDRCRITISNILRFLKLKKIEYYLFYKTENGDDMFEFLFSNFEKDKRKFPKNKYNENKPYLPSINVDGEEIDNYNIGLLFKDNIDGWIDITSMEDIKDLETIVQANKYNL